MGELLNYDITYGNYHAHFLNDPLWQRLLAVHQDLLSFCISSRVI